MENGIYVEFFLVQDGARLRLNEMSIKELIEILKNGQKDVIDIVFGDKREDVK